MKGQGHRLNSNAFHEHLRGLDTSDIIDSVFDKWVGGSSVATTICMALEKFAGDKLSNGEQHVDFQASRKINDKQDRIRIHE